MKMTGHKTKSVYRRYAIASESDLREPGDEAGGAAECAGGRATADKLHSRTVLAGVVNSEG